MFEADEIRKTYREGFEELNTLWSRLDHVEEAVAAFSDEGSPYLEGSVDRVLDMIRSFEPSVSIIGQIKAGKSTLLNALIGKTDLLPSDVNPWTSVITALHLNSRHRPMNTRAIFRFFDQHEWDRLVATGGRLGEMADRAGFESEASEVRGQVMEMRQRTEDRLGDQFEQLIGSNHTFPELDKSIINRYICYGDPDEIEDGATEGVFADLTKSADLYIDAPNLPKGLCLRDTPGVNDTFMMREQITLNAISDSRVCVVVLSAHQAMSTMDLALLRIICSVEAREVLIFVNRIDELEDPAGEQAKIRASIQKTLKRLGGAGEIEILFGSGYWANFALCGKGKMAPVSRAALARLYGDDPTDPEVLCLRAMEASGIHALHKAITKRVITGPGEALLRDVQNEIDAIVEMSETVDQAAKRRETGKVRVDLTQMDLSMKLAEMRDASLKTFDENAAALRKALRERLERARDTFVASALGALQSHIETFGEMGSWNHDPTSLRMMMKNAYLTHCNKLRREGETAFCAIADRVEELLENDLGVYRSGQPVEFPEQPQHKSPTVLARTLSLDLQGTWWRRYWRFGNSKAAEKRYKSVILAETAPLIDDLISDFFDPAIAGTRDVVETFAMNQGTFCKAILQRFDTVEPRAADPDLRKLSA